MAAGAPRLLVVGAGLTGSLLIRQLRILSVPGLQIEIWDKSQAPSGRASTHQRHGVHADLGMQYISTIQPEHAVYKELMDAGVIAPMTARVTGHNPKYMDPTFSHFVAVDGTASLCQHLLRDAVVRPRTMTAIEPVQEAVEHSGGWRVTASDGSVHTFNAVVITVPVPQALQISGVADLVAARGSDLDKRLSAVQYSSRWALAITLPFGAWESVHGLGWGVRYVSSKESESICYVAIDQLKRGWTKSESDPTLVVHGGVPWSLQKNAGVARDREPVGLREEVENALTMELKRLIPEVAEYDAKATVLHKWRFSQVYKGLQDGTGSEIVCDKPMLILAGDGCTSSSGIESCIRAAESAATCLRGLAHL